MKIVINKSCGGFGLSQRAYEFLGIKWDGYGFAYRDDRANKKLVQCVESLGKSANKFYSNLVVVEVPNDGYCHILEHNGVEDVIYSTGKIEIY